MPKSRPDRGLPIITLLTIACSSGTPKSTPTFPGLDAGLDARAPQSTADSATGAMQGGSGGGAAGAPAGGTGGSSSGDTSGLGTGGGAGSPGGTGGAPLDAGIDRPSGDTRTPRDGVPTVSSDARAVQDATAVPAGYGLPPGSSIKVLWIGNSLTDAPEAMGAVTNWTPMPGRLVPMLAELGITMTYGSVILGGAEFSTHAANPTTMAEIANPTYDIVNFQASYDGVSDAASYTTTVRPLYTAAHNAGSIALFEGIWEFGGFGSFELDYGGPVDPQSENAVEGAAAALAGSFPVQLGHCWKAVKNRSAALIPKMHDDGVHQSVLGEYFNALVYARFFSARSVQGITSVHPLAVGVSTADERQLLRETVDSCLTIFYRSSTAPTAALTLQTPTAGQIFSAGQTVAYQATAVDTVSGNLAAAIHWLDGAGTELHVGPSFTQTPPAGTYTVTATVTGSDGKQVSVTREFVVAASGPNQSPTATAASQIIIYNTPFMQINLGNHASDADGTIDWSTLQLDTSDFHGVSAVQDSRDLATVNMNYQDTNFSGTDHFAWRVQDNAGAWSNWATVTLTVGQ